MKFFAVNQDTLPCSDAAAVRRDAAGVPVAFRILRPGKNSLTMDGKTVEGVLSADQIKQILDYHAAKGELIPVDCEHITFLLAQLLGVDESDLQKTAPALAEQAAVGAVALTAENGEVWADVKKWSARARELLTTKADQFYLYFSPVVRGLLGKTPLRITSIALTNIPAYNNLDALAASDGIGFGAMCATTVRAETNNQEKKIVKELIAKLAGLAGLDVAALTADNADLQPLFTALAGKIETLQQGASAFVAGVKDAIGLKDGQGLDVAAGLIISLAAKAQGDATALADAQAKLTAFEKDAKDRLITDLTGAGKLTEAMKKSPWFTGLDHAALKAWGDAAPVVVQQQRLTNTDTRPGAEGVMSQSAIDIALKCGVKPEDVAKTNGLKMPAAA
ncbi:MAG: hypothetical protein NTY53_24600 [Kiritimatiellaeota bacterium]|nr:hypothetical protein [Kiritimatiellota bacterium]